MNRYPATLFLGLISIILCAPALQANKPNIVLIFVDDLGYGDLGCYGSEMIETPSIDKLADEGMRFTDAYVVSPVCGPSRVGLLTGAWPQRFGVYWNPDTTRASIPPEWTLLPELMKDAGYRTGIIGKWNITRDVYASADEVYDPMIWGGDYWPDEDGVYGGVGGGWGDRKEQGVWGPRHSKDEYLTDRLTQHAVNFIESHKTEPFFLYLAYNAPHSPLQAKKIYKEELAHIESEPLRLYSAMVMALDAGVGRLLETIEESNLKERTLVVFMSDNGPAKGGFRGYKEEWPSQIMGSTGGLRGRKGTHYEGGIRVPFIVSWSGRIPENTVNETPVISLDLFPTFAAVSGIDEWENPHIDGIDLLPAWLDHTIRLTPRPLYWASESEHAIRFGAYKWYRDGKHAPVLVDLVRDPFEQHDISLEKPDQARLLAKMHRDWLEQMPEHTNRDEPPIIQPVDPVPLEPVLEGGGRN